jgi:hypothetical protein
VSATSRFDPYALLRALERRQVAYVVIGGLARVLHGSDEVTRDLDITPAVRSSNLDRLHAALDDLDARGPRQRLPAPRDLVDRPVLKLTTPHGDLKLVPEPTGTNGYADLRRRAARQPIGQGLRPPVAAPGDLSRMLEALGRDQDLPRLHALHRIIELDRGQGLEL